MPNSLAREIRWLSAGRIPQGRISVKTLYIASRIFPGSSDGDSWIELQLMGYQIGAAESTYESSTHPVHDSVGQMSLIPTSVVDIEPVNFRQVVEETQ